MKPAAMVEMEPTSSDNNNGGSNNRYELKKRQLTTRTQQKHGLPVKKQRTLVIRVSNAKPNNVVRNPFAVNVEADKTNSFDIDCRARVLVELLNSTEINQLWI